MRRESARRRRAGLTFIEVMVAVAVSGMALALIWGGFAGTARNKERIETLLDRHHEIQAAMDRMARELQMAYVSAQLNPNPALQQSVTVFIGTDRGDNDRLDFCSFSHRRLYRNAHESDQNELSYFLTDYEDPLLGSVKVLARREEAIIDDNPQRGGRIDVMVRDVIGLSFEYLDPRSGEWVREWDTSNAATGAPNLLPAQVKILLEVPASGSFERQRGRTETFATRVTLPLRYGLNHAIYNP